MWVSFSSIQTLRKKATALRCRQQEEICWTSSGVCWSVYNYLHMAPVSVVGWIMVHLSSYTRTSLMCYTLYLVRHTQFYISCVQMTESWMETQLSADVFYHVFLPAMQADPGIRPLDTPLQTLLLPTQKQHLHYTNFMQTQRQRGWRQRQEGEEGRKGKKGSAGSGAG